MDNRKAGIATLLIATGVMLGAFGAHALKDLLPLEKLNSFETGVRYQLIMGVSLFLLALNADKLKFSMKYIWLLFIVGILFFSGSIYLLALQEPMKMDLSFLWPVTPIGGLMLIIGWFWITKNLLFNKNNRS